MPISDKELLFNDLVQPHWDNFARDAMALIQRESLRPPKVFISYAWPSQRYPGYDVEKDIQPWLLGLHGRLTALGINILFDIKTMTLGTNIDQFMQQSVDHSDIVLMIGTQTYRTRSEENNTNGDPTNVKCEVNHIKAKIQQKGSGCVVPILYRGEFHNALPNLGQILGTDCHDEFLYQKNLPTLIEGLFQLQTNNDYQKLKQDYLAQLESIEDHGLSATAVADFAQNRAQKARNDLAMQQEAVNLMLERNAKGHPDYVARPAGTESPSVKLLSTLKAKYSQYTHVQALFGEPMALEGQYINVQMLYQVLEEHVGAQHVAPQGQNENEEEKSGKNVNRKEFQDTRVTSFETIFSKKEPLAINQLFTPAKTLLTEKQKTNEAKPDLPPNLVLLQGRAGIGKTTFVNFVTREWALGRLWQEYNWVFSLRFRDLRNQIFQQAHGKETWTLSDWVYAIHFAAQMNKATFESLWTWLIEPDLKNKKVLFILDGYDEAPTYHPCEQALTDLLNNDTPKILTSRPYGLSNLPSDRRELEIVGFIDENVDKYVSLYFKSNQHTAKIISKNLRTSPALWGSAHIPVTLNILCGILETETDVFTAMAKLNTMSGLYETMEMSLLERAYVNVSGKEREHAAQLKALSKDNKTELLKEHYQTHRQYLGKLAFEAFSKQQLILTPEDINQALKEFEVPIKEFADTIKALLALGLLKKVVDDITHEETNYEFLHLTFQEYYSGHYLLWQVQQNSPTILEDFAKIKLDPRYQIVLWFVAGTIKDKEKFNLFMRALAAPQGGDMLGNVQLGLMVRCSEENWALAKETKWTNAITKMLQHRIHGAWKRFKRGQIDIPPIWIQMLKVSTGGYEVQTGTLDLFAELSSKATARDKEIQRRMVYFIGWLTLTTPATLNMLAQLLADSHFVREEASDAICNLGPAAATSEILTRLTKLLTDSDENVRKAAAIAIGHVGAGAATPEILAQLSKLLTDRDENVSKAAATAIGNLGAAAATPEVLGQLLKLLTDTNSRIFGIAATAIGNLGNAAATPEFLTQLLKLLADNDWDCRHKAVRVLGILGAAAATPEFLVQLTKLLTDSSEDVRGIAASAVGYLGAAAATPEILTQLLKLLVDSSWNVCVAAAGAVGKLGATAATSEILAQRLKLTTESDEGVHKAAAIGNLGPAAATPEILTQLLKLLADTDWEVRKAAANGVGKLGAVATTPEILTQLLKLLADNNQWVRLEAISGIRNLGPAALTPGIIALLPKLLADSNESVRLAAINAIGNLDLTTITPEIIALLPKLLADSDSSVHQIATNATGTSGLIASLMLAESDSCMRRAAATAIGNLGAAAATPEFLARLLLLLTDSDRNVRGAAAETVGNLGAAAAIPDILTQLTKLLIDSDKKVREAAATAVGKLGAGAATPEILAQLLKLLADSDYDMRLTAAVAIGHLGAAATKPSFMITLIKLLAQKDIAAKAELAQTLSKLAILYLRQNLKNLLPENRDFTLLSAALIVGSYLSGNISFYIAHDNKASSYHLRGFTDKTLFNISISHTQAQWFIYWVPKIIQSFDDGTFDKTLADIEKSGMSSSSKNSVAWFDHLSQSGSSSNSASTTPSYQAKTSNEYKKAYGLSDDTVVTEKDKNCVVM